MNTQSSTKVWDPLVRIFHWLLVSAFFTSYLSAEESDQLHILSGYLIISIVVGRVLWGFIGSTHARFKDFIVSPKTAINYFLTLVQRKHPRYLGHNPAGAIMILMLLGSVTATCFTGMLVLGIEEHTGPLASWVQSMGWHDEVVEELHEFFANFTVLLVFFHVSGVIVESMLHKDNLIKAMFTGNKREQL